MASEPIVETEAFLHPIAGDNPAGTDLREHNDPDYAAIKMARRKIVSLAKAARFDSGVDTELTDQWKIIRKLAPALLKKKSKDLEIAAWLAESLLKLYGYPGLKDGLAIISQLIENYWDNIYPVPDEDGLETRIYPLISLNGEEGNGTLVLPIKNAPMLPESDVLLSFTSLTRIRDTMKLEDAAERDSKLSQMGINQQTLQNQIESVTPELATNFIEDLDQTLDSWQKIGELVDGKCQQAGSNISLPLSGVRGALEEVKELYQQIMRNKLESAQPEGVETGAEDTPAVATTSASGPQAAAGPAHSREDAIKQLHAVARYFKKAEPHSPMAGIVERAAEWARLPLAQLMAELIPDANARMHYSLMTGIKISAEAPTESHMNPASSTPAKTKSSGDNSSASKSDWSF
jgi:type VI secretion system protein ImpA